VECVVTGFDEGGDVLIGWSFFQQTEDFSSDVQFEPTGYFRKRNWYRDTDQVLVLGEKREGRPLREVFRDALEWAVELIRTPLVHNDRASGLAAYQSWADAVLCDEEFADKRDDELLHRYMAHQDAAGTVAEGRWYAHNFLNKIQEDVPSPEELTRAAACFDREHSLVWKIWGLVGGPGMSAETARRFADQDVRAKTADLILQARDADREAADLIETALAEW
jgi:hypothetical protein